MSRTTGISFFSVLLLCAFILQGPGRTQGLDHPLMPQQGKLIIIGQQQDSIDGYIRNIGTVPGGIMIYTSVENVDGLESPADHQGGIMNAQHYVNQYPHMVLQLALYMRGNLDDIIAGVFDFNIVKLARWMKSTGSPIYLRIGYEFDLPENGYDPQKYQKAYRRIVDVLRAQRVDNVAYVWHSACRIEGGNKFMDWYPGDDYVDWFAVSIFNPMQIKVAEDFFSIARRHNKSLMIAESAPAGLFSTRAKMDWFKHYFEFIDHYDIKVVSYINSDWQSYGLFKTMGWGDTRVEVDPAIQEMWERRMRHGYLQYSPDLNTELAA